MDAVMLDTKSGGEGESPPLHVGLTDYQPELMKLDEVATLLRVSQNTVRNYVKSKKLRALRLAGMRELRFERKDVEGLLHTV